VERESTRSFCPQRGSRDQAVRRQARDDRRAPWFRRNIRRALRKTPDERRMNAKPRTLKAEFLNQP
jgi:hypothetical protein